MMFIESRNLYHPFLGSCLGIYIPDEFHKENSSGSVLQDLDLYYQPLKDPAIGIIICSIRLILILIGEFVHSRVLILIKKENGLVKEVTMICTITNMIVWPFWVIFTSGTDFLHPINEIIGKWFCSLSNLFMFYSFSIISFNSFIVAAMRYLFIVHKEKVEKFGKRKTKTVFLFFNLFVPAILVVLDVIENAELNPLSYINKCNGVDHKVFLADGKVFLAPLSCGPAISVGTDLYGVMLEMIKRTCCIVKLVLVLVMGLNFFEGIIYFRIFSHIDR